MGIKSCGNTMSYYFYYIFFNAYWTSFDIGEKSIPRQNAVYYMTLLEIFILSSISFSISRLGFEFNLVYAIIIGVVLILIMNHFLLSERVFQRKYDEYLFLKEISKKRRMIIFFGLFGMAGILSVVGIYLSIQ